MKWAAIAGLIAALASCGVEGEPMRPEAGSASAEVFS